MILKNIVLFLTLCLLFGEFAFSQSNYAGKLELNKKDKMFSLISEKDTLAVSIDKKEIDFNSSIDFKLIKIKTRITIL